MTRFTLPPPLMGWDAKAPLAEMPLGYAKKLDNYFADTEYLSLRKGWSTAYTLSDNISIKTLIDYPSAETMIACGGGNIYSTATGDKLNTDLQGSDNWVSVNFRSRIFMANGIDPALVYDGTALTAADFTADVGLEFAAVGVGNGQIIFIPQNSLEFYFAPVGNISGELTAFDLGQIAQRGGSLMAVAAFGRDSSTGYQKNIAFITDQGELIVYGQGTNFSSADTINLVGNFFTARPIGRRCLIPWGADLVCLTENGYNPISQIVANGELIKKSELFSDKISTAVSTRAVDNAGSSGWMGLICPKERFALFNVPNETGFEQHIMNIVTGAWSRFTRLQSYDWCVHNGDLYFASDEGIVAKYGSYSDGDAGQTENYIYGEIQWPYTKMGTDRPKLVKLLNSRVKASNLSDMSYGLGIDYQEPEFEFVPSTNQEGFLWADAETEADDADTRLWDEGAWTIGMDDLSKWYSISGFGTAFSMQLKTCTFETEVQIFESLIEYDESQGALA